MSYEVTIKYLETLPRFAGKPGLQRIQRILQELGNPQEGIKYIHITGTNGKGSTSATIESIVRHAGYKTGLFTSPHLFSYHERIKVNGNNISDKDFVGIFLRVKAVIEKIVKEDEAMKPVLFEVLVAMAFLYFQEQKIELGVMEVGIGGTWDSTNVIDGLVAIITNIDLEHTEVLGRTKEEIAEQKAGIIKKGAAVLTAESDKNVLAVIAEVSKKNSASLKLVGAAEKMAGVADIKLISQNLEGQVFDFGHYKSLQIPFLGNYQMYNTALAVLAAESLREFGFNIDEKAIREGLKNVYWPLRLEIVHKNPFILIDVGHNIHGVKTLHQVMKDLFSEYRKILVLGASYDKPYKEMARILAEEADEIIVTKAQYRGAEPNELAQSIDDMGKKVSCAENVRGAMVEAKNSASPKDLIVVMGGHYLGAEAKNIIEEIF